jgi:hypothetical protein
MLWGIINSLQVIVYLPLLQFSFPGNVKLFCQIMAEAATFDFIPSGEMTAYILNEGGEEEGEGAEAIPYNENFEEMGYQSAGFMDTMGDMIYYEMMFIGATGIVLAVKALSAKSLSTSSKVV